MVDLAVCYFCGASEGVREHPVIPDALSPDDRHQRTVAVCPGCQEKLEAVMAPVVEHVADADASRPGATAVDDPDDGIEFGPSMESDPAPSGDPTPSEGADADAGSDADTDTEDRAAAGRDRRIRASEFPDGTKQVLRLLQNRDRPIQRDGLIELASTAYDLEYPQAQDVVETLLDRGILVADEEHTVSIARD